MVSLTAVAVYIVILLVLGYLMGVLYRMLMKKYSSDKKQKVSKNIGSTDRLIRLFLAVVLFILGVFHLGNPLYLLASGFCLFETFSSWCGLYILTDKNTCSIK